MAILHDSPPILQVLSQEFQTVLCDFAPRHTGNIRGSLSDHVHYQALGS